MKLQGEWKTLDPMDAAPGGYVNYVKDGRVLTDPEEIDEFREQCRGTVRFQPIRVFVPYPSARWFQPKEPKRTIWQQFTDWWPLMWKKNAYDWDE